MIEQVIEKWDNCLFDKCSSHARACVANLI